MIRKYICCFLWTKINVLVTFTVSQLLTKGNELALYKENTFGMVQ